MIDHNSTEVWKGEIIYGPYTNDVWYSVGGWNHPRFQAYLNDVKGCYNLFRGLNLYVTGGLLEDWHSWDIDWVITGHYDPLKIQMAMHCIVDRGFHHKLYPDVHYSQRLYSNYDWQRGGPGYEDWFYEISNTFIREGVKADMSFMEPVDGMYRRWLSMPGEKNLQKHKEGYKYKQPVQIF